jgi:NADPH:quinone reductase-like Zn-dependent oxidoreductase
MKAIVQDRYGSTDTLHLRDVDRPVPADNEVLVRIHAASVNAADWHIMRGDPYVARLMGQGMLGLRAPKAKIRGRDFAGPVEAVGSGVRRVSPGDHVYGEANGAFAEYLCVAEDATERAPANLTFEQAAAVPLAGGTALVGLRDLGKVRAGHQVAINGASGGVGTFAVQIAKVLGAEVTGVCSTRNVDLVRSLGADHVVDYTQDDFTRDARRYDVVFDLVGNHPLAKLRRALTSSGTLVLSGGGVSRGGRPSLMGPMRLMVGGMIRSRFARGQRLLVHDGVHSSPQNLAVLRELVESGKITPIIDKVYPLSDVPEAIRYLETEHARAKVIITV